MLYATLGANWQYGSRITYSFVPDGTSIGGTPSRLFQSLDALYPRTTWQNEFRQAAAVWQAVANINLVEVPDNGSPLAVYGNTQSDPRFGDIRISAIPLATGTLGAAYSPPPLNGGTMAGDIVLNSTTPWQIDAHYDLATVAIHEIGHSLGMSHSTITSAVMFSYYTAIKQSLTNDDVAGIASVYGTRQYDAWNSNGQSNQLWMDSKSLDGWRTPANQITVTNLDITTSGQPEWFWVTIPSTNIGSFRVTAQATGLSMLTPRLTVFDASLVQRGNQYTSGYGGTANLTINGVSTGQGFFIRTTGSGGGMTGAYALQINFGTSTMSPVPPPNTVVGYMPGQGGGLNTMTQNGPPAPIATYARGIALDHDHDHEDGHEILRIGNLVAYGDSLVAGPTPSPRAVSSTIAAARLSGMRSRSNQTLQTVELVSMATNAELAPLHSWKASAVDRALPEWGGTSDFGGGLNTMRRPRRL